MTRYEKFKKLDIDFSWLGLGQGDTRSDYFCTPKGAKVIGWEGVDGIHYCFVKGFGEMVFAINPSNLPGDYVHPLARNFEDFLRLVLACGGTAAVEQAWMWNREEFDAFLETYPPEPEQQAVLDTLRDKLSLTAMDDPYRYIKEMQASFDYRKIPFSKAYFDTMPDEPKAELPPEPPEWKVYFEKGFSSYRQGRGKPGTEISVNKTFVWGGRTWHIPAVYFCGKGLVADFCIEIDLAAYRAFSEKWGAWREEDSPLTPEEEEQKNAENPMTVAFTPKATVNGKELRCSSGNACYWMPKSPCLEYKQGKYCQQDWQAIWLMEHYGLDTEKGWVFWRYSFPWATRTRPKAKTFTLALSQDRQAVPGPRFTVSGVGDTIPFTHPVTGAAHILRVVEYETQEMEASHVQDEEQWEYPTHYTAMSYVVEPELSRESLTVRDCGNGDRPRMKQPDPAGAAAGSAGIILLTASKAGQPRSAASALRFEPPGQIAWRMVFFHKTVEDIAVDCFLPQNG